MRMTQADIKSSGMIRNSGSDFGIHIVLDDEVIQTTLYKATIVMTVAMMDGT